jgi:hypothetical protein
VHPGGAQTRGRERRRWREEVRQKGIPSESGVGDSWFVGVVLRTGSDGRWSSDAVAMPVALPVAGSAAL